MSNKDQSHLHEFKSQSGRMVGKIMKNTQQEKMSPIKNKNSILIGKVVKKGKGFDQFIKRMKKQIRLERQFVNLRHQIKENQRQDIINILSTKFGVSTNILQLEPQEFDPFFVDSKISNTEDLARQIYVQFQLAQNHWNQEIVKQFDHLMLTSLFSKWEQQNSSSISLPRFTRKLNDLLGNDMILKIKDLFRIYHKFRSFSQQEFVSELSRNLLR